MTNKTDAEATLASALYQRHSVRSFRAEQLGERAVRALRSEISYAVSRDAAIHFQLMLNDEKPFSGFMASYGMFRNASDYIACAVDTSYDDCMQRAGYWAEMVALRAVSLGLGTCFVGGTYNSGRVSAQMRVTWRLPFILLIGYPEEKRTSLAAKAMKRLAGSGHRPSGKEMLAPGSLPYDEIKCRWPELSEALNAVAAAPSSMNRRPVRIHICQGKDASTPVVTAKAVKEYAMSQIDLGIAMANWQVSAGGEWEFGTAPIWLP